MLNVDDVPNDVMDLDGKDFFHFVKQHSGEKMAKLLEFQDISNASCFLACQDPLEILSLNSDELIDLKQTTCVKLNNDSFVVLPGIKTKISLLKRILMKKCASLKKLNSRLFSIDSNNASLTMQTQNGFDDNPDGLTNLSSNSSSSIDNTQNNIQIRDHLIGALNDWLKK